MLLSMLGLILLESVQFDAQACRNALCNKRGTCYQRFSSDGDEFYECLCDSGYFGDRCDMNAYECRNTLCNYYGACKADNTCECDEGFNPIGGCKYCLYGDIKIGAKCYNSECITFSGGYSVCGGNGNCRNGECQCFDGYDNSAKCAKCANGFVAIAQACVHENCVTSYGTVCSGRGYCFGGGCVCNINVNGTEKCATCNEGYELVNNVCQPASCVVNGSICSGRGQCIENICYCIDNSDSASKCELCLEGFELADNQCVPGSCVLNGHICGAHGTCTEYYCVCDENYDDSTKCSTCVAGSVPLDGNCVLEAYMNDGKLCNGKGHFISGKCVCEDGFSGSNCAVCNETVIVRNGSKKCLAAACVTGANEECFSNGFCESGTCECKIRIGETYFSNGYLKETKCQNCSPNDIVINNTCYPENCIVYSNLSTSVCSGRGKCILAAMYCQCAYGFDQRTKCYSCMQDYTLIGEECVSDLCIVDGLVCAGNGVCVSGQCYCTGGQDVTSKCVKCPNGTKPVAGRCCKEKCVVMVGEEATECAKHGRCVAGKCQCDTGFLAESICSVCAPNLTLVAGKCVPASCVTNQTVCNGHGDCIDGLCFCNSNFDNATFCRICVQNFTQIDGKCVASSCVKNGMVCSGNGECSNGACTCAGNTTGQFCDGCTAGFVLANGVCHPSECVINSYLCAGHGTCVNYSCSCDTSFDPTSKCAKCVTGYRLVGGACVSVSCMGNGTQICSGHGVCLENRCRCNSQFSADLACQSCNDSVQIGNACFPATCASGNQICSGRGTCTDKVCVCADSAFDPATKCATCRAGYIAFFVNDVFGCYNITVCNIVGYVMCNGHGTCASTDSPCTCAAHYNATANCSSCVEGYQQIAGACVAATCVTDNASVCSGRGTCQNATCVCQGDYSPESQCKSCKENFTEIYGKCVPQSCVYDNQVCYQHGLCVQDGIYRCKCNDHFADDSLCKNCVIGYTYVADTCVSNACVSDGAICSGNGVCGDNKCVCNSGFYGYACRYNATDCARQQCNSHGNCTLDGSCQCESTYYGRTCQYSNVLNCNQYQCSGFGTCVGSTCECYDAHYGPDCTLTSEECASTLCSNNGNCSSAGTCKCIEGKYGKYCNLTAIDCAKIYCSDRGACNGNGGCQCAFQNANSDCSGCTTGNVAVSGQCVAKECVYDGIICSNSGTCYNGSCQCLAGSYGPLCYYAAYFCRVALCSGKGDCAASGTCVCDELFEGDNCSGCKQDYLPYERYCVAEACLGNNQICSLHGACSAGSCTCATDYYGALCEYNQQQCSIQMCSGHGICLKNGTCECEHGYSGDGCLACADGFSAYAGQCFQKSCFAESAAIPCSDGGQCLGGACSCSQGRFGAFCELNYTQCNTQRCGGRGRCTLELPCECGAKYSGEFCDACATAFTGSNCSIRRSVLNAVIAVVIIAALAVSATFLAIYVRAKLVRRRIERIEEREQELRKEIQEREDERRRIREMRESRVPTEDRARPRRYEIVGE